MKTVKPFRMLGAVTLMGFALSYLWLGLGLENQIEVLSVLGLFFLESEAYKVEVERTTLPTQFTGDALATIPLKTMTIEYPSHSKRQSQKREAIRFSLTFSELGSSQQTPQVLLPMTGND